MKLPSAGFVICPNCEEETPIEDVPANDECPACHQTIPSDAPTKIRREVAEKHLELLLGEDYAPAGGVDYQRDEISEPERDVETVTDVLTNVEKGDTLDVTMGAAEESETVAMYVLLVERDVAGFDHRVSVVPKPDEDGWVRLFITGIEESGGELDPWEVVSAPYDLDGDRTLDIRDYAAHGWIIDAEMR